MGWYDFLNNNSVGKAFSKVASSTVDSVDRVAQKGFDNAEKKIDSFDKKGQALGGAIDNLGQTLKNVKNNGLDRNDLDEISENKEVLDETLPKFIKESKAYKTASKVVETSNKITNAADRVNK